MHGPFTSSVDAKLISQSLSFQPLPVGNRTLVSLSFPTPLQDLRLLFAHPRPAGLITGFPTKRCMWAGPASISVWEVSEICTRRLPPLRLPRAGIPPSSSLSPPFPGKPQVLSFPFSVRDATPPPSMRRDVPHGYGKPVPFPLKSDLPPSRCLFSFDVPFEHVRAPPFINEHPSFPGGRPVRASPEGLSSFPSVISLSSNAAVFFLFERKGGLTSSGGNFFLSAFARLWRRNTGQPRSLQPS